MLNTSPTFNKELITPNYFQMNAPMKKGFLDLAQILPQIKEKAEAVRTDVQGGLTAEEWKMCLSNYFLLPIEVLEELIQRNWTSTQIEIYKCNNGGLTPWEKFAYHKNIELLPYHDPSQPLTPYEQEQLQMNKEVPQPNDSYLYDVVSTRGSLMLRDVTHWFMQGRKEGESNEDYIARIISQIGHGIIDLKTCFIGKNNDAPIMKPNFFKNIFNQVHREFDIQDEIRISLALICPYLSIPSLDEIGAGENLYTIWFNKYFNAEFRFGQLQDYMTFVCRQGGGLTPNQLNLFLLLDKYFRFQKENLRLTKKKDHMVNYMKYRSPEDASIFRKLYQQYLNELNIVNMGNGYNDNKNLKLELLSYIQLLKFKFSVGVEIELKILPPDFKNLPVYQPYLFKNIINMPNYKRVLKMYMDHLQSIGVEQIQETEIEILRQLEFMYNKLFFATKDILVRENEMLNEEVEWFQQNAFEYMDEEDKTKFAQYSILIQEVSQGIKAQSENLTKEDIGTMHVVTKMRDLIIQLHKIKNDQSGDFMGRIMQNMEKREKKKEPIIEEPSQDSILEEKIRSLQIQLDEEKQISRALAEKNNKLKEKMRNIKIKFNELEGRINSQINDEKTFGSKYQEVQKNLNSSIQQTESLKTTISNLEEQVQNLKHQLSEKDRNIHQLLMENRVLKEQLAGNESSLTSIQQFKEQLRVKDQLIKTLEQEKEKLRRGQPSVFSVQYNNQSVPQEQIQDLINYLSSQSVSTIKVLNPQNNRYYSTQEDIQDVIDSLFELFHNANKRCNTLFEKSFNRS